MAEAMMVMKIVGAAYSVISAIKQGNEEASQTRNVGEANARAREAQAASMERRAGDERAAGQRRAREERRKARLMRSKSIAAAGASGGGISDPTVEDNLAEMEGVGEFNALSALYEGNTMALGIEDDARLTRHGANILRYESESEARAIKSRSRSKALSTAISKGSSIYGSYKDLSAARPKPASYRIS